MSNLTVLGMMLWSLVVIFIYVCGSLLLFGGILLLLEITEIRRSRVCLNNLAALFYCTVGFAAVYVILWQLCIYSTSFNEGSPLSILVLNPFTLVWTGIAGCIIFLDAILLYETITATVSQDKRSSSK